MALPIWQATVAKDNGDIIPSAVINIIVESTGLPADLFSDRNGTVPLGVAGEFSADVNGFAQFYAAPGNYRITATDSGTGFSRIWRYVPLVGSSAMRDAQTISAIDYGAGTGLDDTQAVISAIAAAPIGGTIVFPATNAGYNFNFDTNGAPLINITKKITLKGEGGVLNVTADQGLQIYTDENGQFLFDVDGVDGVVFDSIEFNGGKNAVVDPSAGLVRFIGCVNPVVKNCKIYDTNRDFVGSIHFDSFNGATNTPTKNIKITDNIFNRNSWSISVKNIWQGVSITDNIITDTKLTSPNGGAIRYPDNVKLFGGRGIRLSGYVDSTVADGEVRNAVISGNTIVGAAYGIEVWNQAAAPIGQNPADAKNITVTSNTVLALFGIGVNSFGGVSITGNTVEYLALDAAAMSAYAGSTTITDTSNSGGNTAGAAIECRPGFGFTVSANTLIGHYDPLAATDYTAASFGIAAGTAGKNILCDPIISGNYIKEWYRGLDTRDSQNTIIDSNHFELNFISLYTELGTNTFGFGGNKFSNNTVIFLPNTVSGGQPTMLVYGGWHFDKNSFIGDADVVSTPLLDLRDIDGNTRVTDNQFVNFQGEAIKDACKTSYYDGNTYDPGTGGGFNGMVSFLRQDGKKVVIVTEVLIGDIPSLTGAAYGWRGAAATGESYSAKNVYIDDFAIAFNKSVSGGEIFDLFADCGVRVAAPTTGTKWARGCTFKNSQPAGGGYNGWVCTATGTPGIWKGFGMIEA